MRIIKSAELERQLKIETTIAAKHKGLKWQLGQYNRNWDWDHQIVFIKLRQSCANALRALCLIADSQTKEKLLPQAEKLQRKWSLANEVIHHCLKKNSNELDPRIRKLSYKLSLLAWRVRGKIPEEMVAKTQLKIDRYEKILSTFTTADRKVTPLSEKKICNLKFRIGEIQKKLDKIEAEKSRAYFNELKKTMFPFFTFTPTSRINGITSLLNAAFSSKGKINSKL